MTLLSTLLLLPSCMTNLSGAFLPGLLLLAEISVYFRFASFRAYRNLVRSSSSSACRFGSFLGGNLLKNLRMSSFWCTLRSSAFCSAVRSSDFDSSLAEPSPFLPSICFYARDFCVKEAFSFNLANLALAYGQKYGCFFFC